MVRDVGGYAVFVVVFDGFGCVVVELVGCG